jgi:hypothetical protein
MQGLDLRAKQNEGLLPSIKNLYEDRKLLEANLPTVSLMLQGRDQSYSYNSLSKFLYDIANELAADAQRNKSVAYTNKIKHEFFAVCLMNALFGNPNLHLNQLHPQYHGPKTLQRMLKVYEEQDLTLVGTVDLDKKRRNAVIEVFRFYNSAVH